MLTKKYIKSRDAMKVTFRVDSVPEAESVELLGEFNEWQPQPLTQLKGGDYKIELDLTPGESYQYLYRIDGRWQNDEAADAYIPNEFGGRNSIVRC
ncbi:MAG: isoamylase early set domain-containing protein [Caldilineales bacterium]|nr:isoamylase early set domain-containing protein [Caldilineales bacterium]